MKKLIFLAILLMSLSAFAQENQEEPATKVYTRDYDVAVDVARANEWLPQWRDQLTKMEFVVRAADLGAYYQFQIEPDPDLPGQFVVRIYTTEDGTLVPHGTVPLEIKLANTPDWGVSLQTLNRDGIRDREGSAAILQMKFRSVKVGMMETIFIPAHWKLTIRIITFRGDRQHVKLFKLYGSTYGDGTMNIDQGGQAKVTYRVLDGGPQEVAVAGGFLRAPRVVTTHPQPHVLLDDAGGTFQLRERTLEVSDKVISEISKGTLHEAARALSAHLEASTHPNGNRAQLNGIAMELTTLFLTLADLDSLSDVASMQTELVRFGTDTFGEHIDQDMWTRESIELAKVLTSEKAILTEASLFPLVRESVTLSLKRH